MKAQILLGSMLATSVALASLAGCQAPNPMGHAQMPGTVNNGNPSATGNTQTGGNFSGGNTQTGGTTSGTPGNLSGAQASNPTTSSDVSQSQADEQDAQAYNATGGQDDSGAAMYAVDAVSTDAAATGTADASASGSADASGTMTAPAPELPSSKPNVKAKARRAAIAQIRALQSRIRNLIAQREAKVRVQQVHHLNQADFNAVQRAYHKAQWHDNGDGTETKDVTVSLSRTQNGKTFSRDMHLVRTIETADKTLVESTVDASESLPSGASHSIHWDKALQADGSYDVVFQNDMKWADKATTERTAAWDKVIATNGDISGTGVITWFKNGQQVSQTKITFGGTEDSTTANAPTATGTPPVAPPSDNSGTPATTATSTVTASGTATAGTGASGTANASTSADASATANG